MMKCKKCQSCSMPLSKDPKGGGSEADGSMSNLYCSYCYQEGAFVDPEISCEEMIVKVKGVLVEMGMPKWLSWLMVKPVIPKLKRWKDLPIAKKTS